MPCDATRLSLVFSSPAEIVECSRGAPLTRAILPVIRARTPAGMANPGLAPRIQMCGLASCASAPKTVLRQPTSAMTGCARPLTSRSGNSMLFAGAAAVFVGGAGREEAAEDAVLGVEDRQMLVGDHFDARRRRRSRARSAICAAFRSCVGVSALQAQGRGNSRGSERVGGIQAEVADQRFRLRVRGASSRPAERTRMRTIQLKQEVDDPLFARLENARAGDAHGDSGGFTRSTEGRRP